MHLFDLFEDAGRKLVIFDIDDTLVNTNTRVIVRRDGEPVHSLNSQEFTHYKLQPGETFDFGAFRNAEEFARESRPIVPMIKQLNDDIASGNRVVMITARADFDDRDTFLNAFRQWNVDMDRVHVYRAGNDTRSIAVDQKKADIVRRLLATNAFAKVIMYDDSIPNLESFVRLHDEHPGVKFYAWHVDHAGRATEYTRGYRAEDVEEGRILHPDRINLYLNLRRPNAKPIVVGHNIPYKAMDAVIQKIVDKYSNVEADMFEFRPARSLREDGVDDKKHHSELIDSLENWMAMEYNFQDIETILMSPESRPFTRPPAGVQWVYRAIVPRSRRLNSIKARGPVVAYATRIEGAIEFVRGLDTIDPWLIVRKPFNPADMLLDFTTMYETIVQPDAHSRYAVEHEVWMRSTPAYNKATKQEVVLTSAQYYADNYAESIHEDSGENEWNELSPKVSKDTNATPAIKDLQHDLKEPYSYDAIDHMMTAIAKKYNMTPHDLHLLFVDKVGTTPDVWIRKTGATSDKWINKQLKTSVSEDDNNTHNYTLYDKILLDLTAMSLQAKRTDPDHYGYVSACVINKNGNRVYAVAYKQGNRWVHSELAAIEKYREHYGEPDDDCVLITTLSPCSEKMQDRVGVSCTDLINQSAIRYVYAGCHDADQSKLSKADFHEVITKNPDIEGLCKSIADCFLDEGADTDPANYRGESITEAKKRRAKTLIDGMIKTLERQGRTKDEAIADIKKQVDAQFYESIDHLVENFADGVPQPGPSSGAPKKFGPDAKITTRKMTVGQIISSIPGVPYYNNVVDDWDAKDYHSWNVTEKAIEYAKYFKKHPESLAQLDPIIVLNGKFEDGAHRVSAIWLLQQRMDPKNPLWTNAKLNVQFVKQGVAEGSTNSPQTVTRIDSQQIKDFGSNLKAYKHTDDWSQSGIDTGNDSYWKNKNLKTSTTNGLFAGDQHRTALYATGNAHETRYVEFTQNGQPIVYFDKKDLPKMRGRKTYLTVFDAANFRKLPTGEYFSETPGTPLKQTVINDPFQYIADQGWIVRITDDLGKVFKQVKNMHKAGKIAHYGAEGMNESKQGVAENFADGKKPGRRGLSKRMGVNTKASVSSLRKTAKHSTGEKARMAHWLANMKAGKAKKK